MESSGTISCQTGGEAVAAKNSCHIRVHPEFKKYVDTLCDINKCSRPTATLLIKSKIDSGISLTKYSEI
jgi:hypothetical protein